MPLQIDLLEVKQRRLTLRGSLPVEDLRLEMGDELLHFRQPLEYDLTADFMDDAILVQGRWRLPVDCECARCLKPFTQVIDLSDWACHLPLTGPDKVSHSGDLVDLTSPLREDILLTLPHHPVCESDCRGLQTAPADNEEKRGARQRSSGAWAALDKLKL